MILVRFFGFEVPKRACGYNDRNFKSTALASPEQADRPPHQQRDHDEIDEKRAELGKIIFAGHVADAEEGRGNEGAGNRAEPADRDHDQDIDQVGEGEGVIEADYLDGKRPAEAGKTAAERKGDGEDAIDIDAEAARHALVVDRRPHLRPE